MKVFYTHESYATVVVYCLYLEFEHGTQFFLSDLQRANLRGQSHDGGVETLVLLLRDISHFSPVLQDCFLFLLPQKIPDKNCCTSAAK